MATSLKKVTSKISDIQSKAQEAIQTGQKQVASSTQATQSWSTTTPTVTETPKVASTAKAMPSITRPDISSIVPTTTPTTTTTVNAKDLLWSRTQITWLRKAEIPDLLDWETNTTWIAWAINKLLYENPQQITQEFIKTDLFDKTKNIVIDTARFWISTVQWWLERYGDSPIVWLPKSAQEWDMWIKIKEQRDETLKSAFDKLESRDQWLSKDKWYKEAKERAEEWSASWKSMRQALQEWNWDVYLTRWWEILGQIIPALATSIITKNPKTVAWTVFTTVYWDAYKRNLTDVVKDPDFKDLTWQQKTDVASLLATTEAVIETIRDMLELAPFMKWKTSLSKMLWIKNAFASFLLNRQWTAVTEWLEEVSTEVLQTFIKQAYGSLDKISLKELWRIFSDTYALMQFAWLPWWAWWVIETRNRNKEREELSREADKYDNFNDFEADAQRWWIEDKELIQEAWSKSKWLNQEQTSTMKYDQEYVENLEDETSDLYEEKDIIENKIEELKSEPKEDKEQISKLETRLQEIDNRIQEIDKSIQEYMDIYWKEETTAEDELPATQQEQQMPAEAWWENLSEQTMKKNIDNKPVISKAMFLDKKKMRKSFNESVEQIKSWEKTYSDTSFANYAYWTSWKYILWDKKQRRAMIKKVLIIANKAWLVIHKWKIKWAQWQYKKWNIQYDTNELTTYWHEIFHWIKELLDFWDMKDQEKIIQLQKDMDEIIKQAKEYLWIDKYFWIDWEYADDFAEEWLANAFWEYLAERELPELWPKTFRQKVIDFFNRLINTIFWMTKEEWPITDEMKRVFESIANWEIEWTDEFREYAWKNRNTMEWEILNPIESSTEFTQEELQDMDWYKESQEENKKQSEQQDELWEHWEEIAEAGKQSDYENDIYNKSKDVELSEDVTSGKVHTTSQTIRDAFWKDKKKSLKALSIMKTEVVQAYHDVMTSAKTRILNISPRIAWRLVQMETQRDIYTHRYRERAKSFVEQISKLDKNAKLEIKKALLDYWALAYEQWENIEQYKQEEVAKLKEVLNKYWISEEATNDMFAMLSELWQRYKDAWLSITLSDIYFPRTVTDYEWLQQYISEQTWIPQENKATLLARIEEITRNPKLTEEEKEKKIRNWMTKDYHEPWKKSKNAKERKMWLLSEWWEWIYQFYWDPIESLDNYIVNMEDAIQKQLFLWWLQKEAWLKDENVSLEEIIEWLVVQWKISNEDLEEIKKSVSAVLNKKPTPKIVSTAKSIIHIWLLANFMSAITQFDDLWVVILRDRSWLKNIVKAFFWKAWIKYTDLWLENSYEIFKDQMNITNWFFAKSFFNAIDRLGKTSFVNTAWESLKRQANKNKDWTDTKSRKNLIKRLTDMYWVETANHIMEKIDSWSYMTNWQIDIDVLTDLLYLLSDTQPIYTSDMPTAYLNNGWVRLCYSLQSFTIKRINMLLQWTKQVYKNNWWWAEWAVRAWVWLMYTTAFLAMFWAMVWDAQDWLKWEKDETTLYKLITEWIDEAMEQLWKDAKGSWLKIWNLSDYDKKIYSRQWSWWWLMSKFEPPIIWMGADFVEAITEHNEDEMTDLAKYVPIIWKLLYYWFWDELESDIKNWWEWWEISWDKEDWESSGWEEDWETSWEKEDWE